MWGGQPGCADRLADRRTYSPTHPGRMDWSAHFPAYCRDLDPAGGSSPKQPNRNVTVADIGCGFGGLLLALSELLPSDLILGMPSLLSGARRPGLIHFVIA